MQAATNTVTLATLGAEAAAFVAKLRPTPGTATVVGLYGDLGAGKTSFMQACARELGVVEQVTSPTFIIEKRYPIVHQGFETLVHIDAYRLDSPVELIKIGWNEIVAQPKNLICIEWADRVEELIPNGALRLALSVVDEGTRTITYGTKS